MNSLTLETNSNNMENIFICVTPLEILIAEKIIKFKKIPKQECRIIFLIDKISKKNNYYFNRIKKISTKSNFFLLNKFKYPNYYFKINKLVKKTSPKIIYIAAIDSSLIQYVLSKNIFKKIYTFDDGIGNLTKTYNTGFKKPTIKKILDFMLGINFGEKKIFENVKNHYTIYLNKKNNFSKKPIFIGNLFKKVKFNKSKTCSIIIGPVFRDLYHSNEKEKQSYILKKFKSFLKKFTIDKKVYIINHPRELENKYFIKNLVNINTKYLAEEYIIKIMSKKFNKITLYSFPVSTVSINLQYLSSVKNVFFNSLQNSGRSFEAIKVANKFNLNYKQINLDKY